MGLGFKDGWDRSLVEEMRHAGNWVISTTREGRCARLLFGEGLAPPARPPRVATRSPRLSKPRGACRRCSGCSAAGSCAAGARQSCTSAGPRLSLRFRAGRLAAGKARRARGTATSGFRNTIVVATEWIRLGKPLKLRSQLLRSGLAFAGSVTARP